MQVLVLESEPGAADAARAALRSAGHLVRGCHEADGVPFPCRGLQPGGDCPLAEAPPVDVALTVRPNPRSEPTMLEDGVACALRHHVPLVVAGNSARSPYTDHAVETVGPDGDVVGACERAASAALPEHGAAARQALRQVLAQRGGTGAAIDGADAVVHRRVGGLRVELRPGRPLEKAVAEMAAVRTIAALRALDPTSGSIDVLLD